MAKRPKYVAYVVKKGRIPGLYLTWQECNPQVTGFKGNEYRGYVLLSDAQKAWEDHLLELDREKEAALVSGSLPVPPLKLNLQEEHKSSQSSESPGSNPKRSHSLVGPTASGDEIFTPAKKRQICGPTLGKEECYEDEPRLTLSPEQEAVADLAIEGHNIFITGAGGCGKTVTIKEIIARFKEKNIPYEVVAPTGIAALPLGGRTAHSFMSWDHDTMRAPLKHLLHNPMERKWKAIMDLRVLIIEEISMVENQFLERMNLVLQYILQCERPFGGKQLIILGDFHQLPPVKPFEFCLDCGNTIAKSHDPDCDFTCIDCDALFQEDDKWAFKAPVWKALNLRHVRLEKIHRQKDDSFKAILDKIRYGRDLEPEEWETLEMKKETPYGICPVQLMARRLQVDETNRRELAAIHSQPKSWEAIDKYKNLWPYPDSGASNPWEIDNPLKDHRFPETLILKVGAKVVLLANLDQKRGLVNGSQGVIIGFQKYNNADCEPSIEYVEGNPQKCSFPGVRCYKTFSAPVVQFANGRKIPILAVESRSCYGPRKRSYVGIRVQIPLKLAWALTIHKSQGMTLDFIKVSSRDIFEKGQLYVALSRATKITGVTVTGFSRDQLPCDEGVLSFYENTKWETFVNDCAEQAWEASQKKFVKCDDEDIPVFDTEQTDFGTSEIKKESMHASELNIKTEPQSFQRAREQMPLLEEVSGSSFYTQPPTPKTYAVKDEPRSFSGTDIDLVSDDEVNEWYLDSPPRLKGFGTVKTTAEVSPYFPRLRESKVHDT